MQINLKSLTLNNFKGVAKFTLEPQGNDCLIRGSNATGKTTLFDAFLWLLFNKDSRGRSDFQIKTVDDNGEEYTGLDHSVEAVLDVDGKEITLKKLYKEQWTKKRGAAHKTLTGHTVDYYIDDVPVKQKEWKQKISELVEEETFKLLTSPFYFNSLHWEKRRNLLLEICGDIEDNDVVQANPDLAQLNEILSDRTIEDHKKVVANRKKEINNRLQEVPARIDELQNSINNVANLDKSSINTRIKDLEEQIEQAKSGSQVSVLRKQKADLQAELSEKQNQRTNELNASLNEHSQQKQQIEVQLSDAQHQHQEYQKQVLRLNNEVEEAKQKMDELRQQYRDKSAEQPEIEETCPTCGQHLPQDQVEKATENFNTNKAQQLKEINKTGKEWKQTKEQKEQKLKEVEQEVDRLATDIQEHKNNIKEIDSKIADIKDNFKSSLSSEIDSLEEQIQELDQQIQNSEGEVDTTELQQQLEAERSRLSQLDAAENSKNRIKELKEEEQQLSRGYEKLEQETYLMEQFVVQKVNMLEEKINSKFNLARFKLFEQQINEGIKETCITTYQGVPFGQGLNNGASIAVGLDIIKTLQEEYGIKAPIWIDNKESITWIPDINCQVISLIVDDNYQTLTVEE